MKVLELFAGSRSVGKVAEELGHNVFSVDWEPYDGIDLVADIGEIHAGMVPFVPDVIWASPDCTTYSIAAISTHRNGIEPKTEYAKFCDETNQHLISLIKKWQSMNPSLVFFIENPRGMLGKMPFMQEFIKREVWYCQYGDDRAKPTHIFTNFKEWRPREICRNGNPDCHHQRAPRGSDGGTQGRTNSYERSRIPRELIENIFNDVQRYRK